MNHLKEYTEKLFEDIKHIDENGNEYWYARELQKVLEYSKWDKFLKVINNAKIACEKSGYNVDEQLPQVGKLSKRNNGAIVKIKDYKLSRYACYLIVQNGDPRKEVIALAQTYFAVQTRKQELLEKTFSKLSEDENRIIQRNRTRVENKSLNYAALNAGVKNFDRFHNAGYKGLYNGETADDIAKRKKLRYREEILDNMSSEELIDNLFRISLTKQKINNENIQTSKEATKAHFEVGRSVRETIEKQGGTLPEQLPTPNKSIKELEKGNKYEIEEIN